MQLLGRQIRQVLVGNLVLFDGGDPPTRDTAMLICLLSPLAHIGNDFEYVFE